MRKYVVNEQQLDEIKWLKNLARRYTEPGRGQNVVGRERLVQTQEKLYGEIQNYLGMRDMSLSDLTPKILAKFLNSYDIAVDPNDIPADPNGIVNKNTVKDIVKDLSIKSLTGEPLTYDKPADQSSVLKRRSQTAAQPASTATNDYLKNWVENVKKAVDDDATNELAKELLAFLSQKFASPDGAKEVADTMSAQKPASSPAPASAAPSPSSPATASPSAKAKTSAKKPNNPSTSQPSSANTTKANADKNTPSKEQPKAAPKQEPKAEPKAAPQAAPKQEPKAEPKAAPKTPAKSSSTKAAPKAAPKAEPTKSDNTTKKPEKNVQTVVKGGQKISLPVMPGGKKSESIANIVAAINEGKKFPSGLKIDAKDYKYFVKILETLNLTIKDLGLWRVLKESNDQYVTLQVR